MSTTQVDTLRACALGVQSVCISIPMLRFSVAERGFTIFFSVGVSLFQWLQQVKSCLPPVLDSLAWSGHARLGTGRLFCVCTEISINMDAFDLEARTKRESFYTH